MNKVTLTPADVADLAVARGVSTFWTDRIHDMADHGWTVGGRRFGDRVVSPYVAAYVNSAWPLKGQIVLTREDGVKVRLRLKGTRPGHQKFTVTTEGTSNLVDDDGLIRVES